VLGSAELWVLARAFSLSLSLSLQDRISYEQKYEGIKVAFTPFWNGYEPLNVDRGYGDFLETRIALGRPDLSPITAEARRWPKHRRTMAIDIFEAASSRVPVALSLRIAFAFPRDAPHESLAWSAVAR